MGHPQVRELVRPEPAQVVVLLGCGVDRFSCPVGDEEPVHVQGGVADRHRDWHEVVDLDTDLLEAFPSYGLMRFFARLDMPTDEGPAVGIRMTQ